MADAPSPHGLFSDHHSGTLDNSQIPQALLTDGSRTLAGNLPVASGITVDGVDISVLKNNYDTHLGDPLAHNYIRNLLDDSDVAADKGVTTNDVRIYGDGDITVTKTVDGLLIAYAGGGGGGGGTFSGIKDPAGTGVVDDGLGWILTTDDNVVNVAASGANTLAFTVNQANINHGSIGGVSANQHHNQQHVLATTSGLGPDHTVSGLTSGQVLRASGATTALFGNLAHSETGGIGANDHHNQSHVLATNTALGADHTISGATAGHVLRASSATAAAFSQLALSDLSGAAIGTNLQAWDADLDAIAALAKTDGNIIVGNGTTWVAESGATARTSLGVGTGDSPQFTAINLGHATDTTIARVSAGLISVEGDIVTLNTATQTLTNKTLTTPTIASFANATHNHSNAAGGGTVAHSVLTGIGANDHHNQSHLLATNAGLGADHTISGATAGHVLRASSATAAAFAQLAHSELASIGTNTHAQIDTHISATEAHGATGAVVGTTNTQTLTNKTLTTPTIASFVNATHNHSNATGGGTIDHGALTGRDDDDHTLYLLATGTRTGASSSSQTFTTGVIDSSLTATRLMASDGSKKLASVADLTSWIGGTSNRVTVTSDGDGTVTLSGPQNIHSAATPTFARLTLSQATGTAPLTVSSTTVVTNLNADKADGYDFDQDVRTTGVPQFARIGAGVAAHGTYKLYVLGDSLLDGHAEIDSADVNGALNVYGGDFRVFNSGDFTTPVLYVDESALSVGINRDPDIQFSLDVAGALRADWLIGPHAIQLSDAEAIMHFDGPGPYETNFVGTSQTHKGKLATLTGGVIYRPGKFQKAVQVAPATTNLVTNPSFETSGTSSWTLVDVSSDGSIVQAQSDEQALYGTYSLKLTQTTAGLNEYAYFRVTSPGASTTYTASAWYKCTSFTAGALSNRGILFYDSADGANLQIATITAVSDGWVRLTVTLTTTATPGNVDLRLYAPQGTVYWDGVQIGQLAYATPYCDGSLGAGHSWSGTAHASTSSRTGTKIEYPIGIVDVNAGTLAMWVNTSGYNGSGGFLWSAGDSNGEWDAYINSTGTIVYRLNGSNLYSEAGKFPLDTWVHVAFTWDATANETMVYINGVLESSVYAYSTLPTLHATLLGIGCSSALSAIYAHNGLIDEVFILSRAADADEIRAIYESNAPVFAESSVAFFKSYGPTPVEINEEGLWVEGPTVGAIFGIYGAASTKSWGGVTLSEGDILIGRSPAYALWDDSETKLKIGNVSDEHIAFDGTKIEFLNGATSMGSLTNTTWVLGQVAGDRLELTSTDLRFKTGASQVDAIFDANSITLGSATTMQTVITNSSFLTGDADGENVYITSAGVYIRNSSTVYTSLVGTALTVGEVGASKSNAYLASGGLQLRNNTTVKVDLQSDGDVFVGTDTSAAATTTLAVFSAAQTYNGETMGVGDLLLGDNTTGKANLWWDKSAGTFNFRGGATTQAYISTTGAIVTGGGAVTLNEDGLTLEANPTAAIFPEGAVKWISSVWEAGATVAQLWFSDDDATIYGYLETQAIASKDTAIYIVANAPTGETATIVLQQKVNGAGNSLTLDAGGTTVSGLLTLGNTGLHILDTNASHDLIIAPGSDLSADTTLTLTMTANRTLTISGSATLNDWFDQSVKTTGTPTFAQMTVDNLVLNSNTLSSTSGVVALTPLAGQNIQMSLSSGGLVDVRSAEPVVRITNTSNLSSPGWDDTVVGDLDFYTTDATTNYVASVVARVRAVASAVSGNAPVSDLSFWTGSGNDGATPSHVLSEKMRLYYNGNLTVDTDVLYVDAVNNRVGVNKTPGAFNFDVGGGANFDGLVKMSGGWSTSHFGVYVEATDPSWKFEVNGNSRFTGDAYITAGLQVDGNTTLGNASTDTITHTGRAIFRTAASDPQHVTAGSRPAGSVGEIVYYAAKMYFCTNAATPTWEKLTST